MEVDSSNQGLEFLPIGDGSVPSKPRVPPLPLDKLPVRHPPLKALPKKHLSTAKVAEAACSVSEKPAKLGQSVAVNRSSCLTTTTTTSTDTAQQPSGPKSSINKASEVPSQKSNLMTVEAAENALRRLLKTTPPVDPSEMRCVLEGVLGTFEVLKNNAELAERRWTQSTDSVKRLENLALDQYHEQGKSEGEVTRLKEELAESKKERDGLLQENQSLNTKLNTLEQKTMVLEAKKVNASVEVEQKIREAEDSRDELEVQMKRTQGDLQQLESTLVDCKLRLAQLKTENEEYKKVIQYYVRHLEVCDPRYIIPLGDRRGIQELQLADVPARPIMKMDSVSEKKRSSMFRRKPSSPKTTDKEHRGSSNRLRSLRTLLPMGRRRESMHHNVARGASLESGVASAYRLQENTSPQQGESGKLRIDTVSAPRIASQTPRVTDQIEPLSTSRFRMREGGSRPEFSTHMSARINQKEFKPSVVDAQEEKSPSKRTAGFFFRSRVG